MKLDELSRKEKTLDYKISYVQNEKLLHNRKNKTL